MIASDARKPALTAIASARLWEEAVREAIFTEH
jgi:hypothetical protein